MTTQQPPTGRTWPVTAVLLLFFAGAGASLPALPAAVREAGAGPASLGVTLGLFPFAALAGRLVAGRLTDRRGRILTLRLGLALTVAAGVVFTLDGRVTDSSVAAIGTGRALHGLADALLYTAASAYVLDRTPVERRPQALSLLGAAIWAGYALGPLAGAVLDLRQVGLVVAGGALVGLVVTRGLVESRVDGPRATGARALLPRGVALPGVSLGLGNLGYAALVGLGYCVPFPALASLVAGRVPASQRGAAIGALVAFYDVFVGIGSVAGGLVAARSGTDVVFVLAAAGVLAAAAVNVVLSRQSRVERVLADAAPDA